MPISRRSLLRRCARATIQEDIDSLFETSVGFFFAHHRANTRAISHYSGADYRRALEVALDIEGAGLAPRFKRTPQTFDTAPESARGP